MTEKETIDYWIKQHSNAVDKCSELQAENKRLKKELEMDRRYQKLNALNKALIRTMVFDWEHCKCCSFNAKVVNRIRRSRVKSRKALKGE